MLRLAKGVYALYKGTKYQNHDLIKEGGSVLEGGVRVRGDAVLRCFWCGFSEIFF